MGKKKVTQKTQEEIVKDADRSEATSIEKSNKQVAKYRCEKGNVYIQATYNNTIVTVTDEKGNVVTWMSAGSLGFSGPKKATPFAAAKVAEAVVEKIKKSGPFEVKVFVKGVGSGRDSAVRTLAARGLNVTSIKDMTPVPHNGPKPKKVRRV